MTLKRIRAILLVLFRGFGWGRAAIGVQGYEAPVSARDGCPCLTNPIAVHVKHRGYENLVKLRALHLSLILQTHARRYV